VPIFALNQPLGNDLAGGGLGSRARGPDLVGSSPAMREVRATVAKLAAVKTTVLVVGESGTGKELVARELHARSPRAAGPFVAVNCAAIPEPLLESELFGHRKGAFTDATERAGLFEQASGGTLFLDEIGELPLGLQAKLLRALQEQVVRPLGGTREIKVDVRVIAATVRDLAADVAAGRFRQDLFYRLNVVGVRLPPLRERRQDIPELVAHVLDRLRAATGMAVDGVTPSALARLCARDWPGNVRELANTLERAVVLADADWLDETALPEPPPQPELDLPEDLSIKRAVRQVEESLIRKALRKTGGNRTKASELLEISHRTLLYKLKELGIERA
jgi:two-component system response regulator AtoC